MCIVTNGHLVNERMEQEHVLQIVIMPMVIALCLSASKHYEKMSVFSMHAREIMNKTVKYVDHGHK